MHHSRGIEQALKANASQQAGKGSPNTAKLGERRKIRPLASKIHTEADAFR